MILKHHATMMLHDGPRMITAKNEDFDIFICWRVEESLTSTTYLCVEIGQSGIEAFEKDQISTWEIFGKSSVFYKGVTSDYRTLVCEIIQDVPEKWMPGV